MSLKTVQSARMLALSALLCACFVTSPVVRAENGRDFAGQYVLSGVVASNGVVSAMLTVRIFNYSGHALWGARVLAGLGVVVADNFSLANHTSQVIRVPVIVSSQEFARWRQGPPLAIEYRDAGGALSRRPVELFRAGALPMTPEAR